MSEGLEAAAGDSEIPDQRLWLIFVCARSAIDATFVRIVLAETIAV
jgi:predicted RNA polymerase sigma factor